MKIRLAVNKPWELSSCGVQTDVILDALSCQRTTDNNSQTSADRPTLAISLILIT